MDRYPHEVCLHGLGDAVPLATISGADTGVYHPGRLAVAPPLSILITSLRPARIGHPYAATLRAGLGTSPYRWSAGGSRLPRGLHLQAGTGTITGLPAQAGKFRIVIKVSDSGRPSMAARQALVLRVKRS